MSSHWMVSISLLIMAGRLWDGHWWMNRCLRKVTVDGQRVRLQLEIEVKKPKEDIKKQAEEPVNSVDWWRKWMNMLWYDRWQMQMVADFSNLGYLGHGTQKGHVIRSSGHQWSRGRKRWGQELIMQNAALLYGEAGNVEECGFLCLNGI